MSSEVHQSQGSSSFSIEKCTGSRHPESACSCPLVLLGEDGFFFSFSVGGETQCMGHLSVCSEGKGKGKKKTGKKKRKKGKRQGRCPSPGTDVQVPCRVQIRFLSSHDPVISYELHSYANTTQGFLIGNQRSLEGKIPIHGAGRRSSPHSMPGLKGETKAGGTFYPRVVLST